MNKVILCILDGVGIRDEEHGNAVKLANMPNFTYLMNNYPNSLLEASGTQVGLPARQMGNSEVGHSNIGAGRILYQPLEVINNSISDRSFFNNKEILNVINHTKDNNSKLHVCGLLSDGGIHSDINHLFNLIDMIKDNGIKEVFFHVFLDGRDTKVDSGINFIHMLQEKINSVNLGSIATVSGRFYAMDRDNRWERISKAYDVMVNGYGTKVDSIDTTIINSYNAFVTDEFIEPFLVDEKGLIKDNDGIIVFNFRPDRLRELFYSITNPSFSFFDTKKLNNIKLVTMFPVSSDVICTNAFKNQNLSNTLGEYLESQNKTQLRIAETEKYYHVTYFFDGGETKEFLGKDQILIPSPKVLTYDLKPEMSAYLVTDKLLELLNKNQYDVVIVNYANGDMVGHTGKLTAAIKGLEAVDDCLGRLYNYAKNNSYIMIVCADHGNCEYMLDDNNNELTTHTTNKVPFIITMDNIKVKDGKLADIAPTILNILDLDVPNEMDGNILIEKNC